MLDVLRRHLTLVCAVGSGLAGGVFLAFSTFVMSSLGRLPDRQGLTAMQQINRGAPNPVFMTVLFGTAGACVVLGVSAIRHLDEPTAPWQLAGSACYLVAIALTVTYHVPHNDALAALDPAAAQAGVLWRDYLRDWTTWNHARTVACAAAATLFTVAARLD
ncbi:DUF1772 domain-containing protein [Nocardioides sp.]|uniref:anthrone oxygenase family protein n=1 Tax=Nocardioides sp. TaxID=35761 RepID=UPI003D0D1A60